MELSLMLCVVVMSLNLQSECDWASTTQTVARSTYYCRRSTDVLAASVGSVWYSFMDAVSDFNQIRNTKRAREVLAIVAHSGKYLPIGLTFGPVNGPDDFNYVVDRAYAPGVGGGSASRRSGSRMQ